MSDFSQEHNDSDDFFCGLFGDFSGPIQGLEFQGRESSMVMPALTEPGINNDGPVYHSIPLAQDCQRCGSPEITRPPQNRDEQLIEQRQPIEQIEPIITHEEVTQPESIEPVHRVPSEISSTISSSNVSSSEDASVDEEQKEPHPSPRDKPRQGFVKSAGISFSGVERKNMYKSIIRVFLTYAKRQKSQILQNPRLTSQQKQYLVEVIEKIRLAYRSESYKKDCRKVIDRIAQDPLLLGIFAMALEKKLEKFANGRYGGTKEHNRNIYRGTYDALYRRAKEVLAEKS